MRQKRIDRLVQDLLIYTKSSALPESVEALPVVDAGLVLDRAMTNLSHAIQESNAEESVVNTLPRLQVEEVHLLQLFQNLIENAIKYRGSKAPHIRIESEKEDDEHWKISFMTTELESLLNTRTRYSESSSDSIRPTSTPGPGSGWRFVRSWSRDMVGEFGLSPEEKGKILFLLHAPRSVAKHPTHRRGVSISCWWKTILLTFSW